MNPWPVAFTAFGDMKIKVYSAKKAGKSSAPAGEVLAGKSLVVSCGDGGSVELCEVQLVGSRRMTSEEMLYDRKLGGPVEIRHFKSHKKAEKRQQHRENLGENYHHDLFRGAAAQRENGA